MKKYYILDALILGAILISYGLTDAQEQYQLVTKIPSKVVEVTPPDLRIVKENDREIQEIATEARWEIERIKKSGLKIKE